MVFMVARSQPKTDKPRTPQPLDNTLAAQKN